jgi:putative transposase
VRDLASRYVLCVQHLDRATDMLIGRVMQRLFRRYGLPRALRMDNGQPFGAIGPRGWSRLNIVWLKLGLRLEHGRPGCPQDNAEHEQMHRVLKERTTRPPAANVLAQQRRFERWRSWYNHQRPHEHHDQQPPAAHYQTSRRLLPAYSTPWQYPAPWLRLVTDPKGRWRWRGRTRYLGRAFVGEQLGARTLSADRLALYLGPHLLGHLHADDPGGLRPSRPIQKREGLTPLPNPPRSSLDHLNQPNLSAMRDTSSVSDA